MSELTTPSTGKSRLTDPVLPNAIINRNGLVALNTEGLATPATKAPDLLARGIAAHYIDNTIPTENPTITVYTGVFILQNDIDHPLTRKDIGGFAYMLNESTVTADPTGSSIAGRLVQIMAEGTQVSIEITGLHYG